MQLFNLKLVLEFGHCNGTMNVIIQDRHGILDEIIQPQAQQIQLDYNIKLPNQISIILSNKNYNTDTKLDNTNNIVQNKYVKLLELWLGNIKINHNTILQLCAYKNDCNGNHEFTDFWDRNGIVTLELFDKNFIELLLHYKNTINF